MRRLQIDLGLWRPKKRRAKRVFQLRQRRPRFGELVQIDGSPHDWFEGRGPRCTLIVFIDDATSRLTVHQFAEGRLRFSYKERALTCTAYGTYAMPDPAEDEKTLDVQVAAIIAAQRTSQGAAGLAAS